MPIPPEILAVPRPRNTIVVAYGKNKDRYAVRARKGCRREGKRSIPINGPTVGHIVDGVYVPLDDMAEEYPVPAPGEGARPQNPGVPDFGSETVPPLFGAAATAAGFAQPAPAVPPSGAPAPAARAAASAGRRPNSAARPAVSAGRSTAPAARAGRIQGFHERTHAYLVVRYYTRLKETFGAQGVRAFIHGVQYYAGQRGRRMAQRAIRDGEELTHAVFLKYGELKCTSAVSPGDRDVVWISPAYEVHIRKCPWYEQFAEMDALEAGRVYCSHIDEALYRGFNPEISFRTTQNLCEGAPYCLQRVEGTNYTHAPRDPARTEYQKDFSYHCGHFFWSMRAVCRDIFGEAGETVSDEVLADFTKTMGAEMTIALCAWKNTDFNSCEGG